MRHILIAGIMVLAVAGMAAAQDFPKIELFGGYSLLRIGGPDVDANVVSKAKSGLPSTLYEVPNKYFKKGGTISATYNVKSYMGVEVSAQLNQGNLLEIYGNWDTFDWGTPCCQITNGKIKVTDFSLMAGPRFAYRKYEQITPFAHVLAGINRADMKSYLFVNYVDRTSLLNIPTDTVSGLGVTVGGGVDIKATDRISVRILQADYVQAFHKLKNIGSTVKSDFELRNVVLSWGVVYKR
jgi:opacity protein-like surface antigen